MQYIKHEHKSTKLFVDTFASHVLMEPSVLCIQKTCMLFEIGKRSDKPLQGLLGLFKGMSIVGHSSCWVSSIA